MFVYFLFVCIFYHAFKKYCRIICFFVFILKWIVAIFGTSTRPSWVQFYFPSFIWGQKLHCSLLGSLIFYFLTLDTFDYLVNDFMAIRDCRSCYNPFGFLPFPYIFITCVSLYKIFMYFFGNPCPMSISDVSKMYSYSSLKRQFSLLFVFWSF